MIKTKTPAAVRAAVEWIEADPHEMMLIAIILKEASRKPYYRGYPNLLRLVKRVCGNKLDADESGQVMDELIDSYIDRVELRCPSS